MDELEKIIKNCELIVSKKLGKLIEKILRYYDMDISHERFKAIIYCQDEFQTSLEEKVKNYYDAYLYLLMNCKSPLTEVLIQKFYYIIFGKELKESIASKISSQYIFLSNESRITKAIDFHLYVYSLFNEEKEYERWLISLMFFNYVLVKENIPCIHLNKKDLDNYVKYRNNVKRLKEILYDVVVYSKFQKKSYTKGLKELSTEDIEQLLIQNQYEIQEKYKIDHIFIYGSFSKNTARIDSDIDLLVIFKEDMNYTEKTHCREELTKYLTNEFCRYVDIQEIFECIQREVVLEATKIKKIF